MNSSQNRYISLAEKFKVLGHPKRVAIMNLLCNCKDEKMTVKDLYEALKTDQPSMSRHLNLMRKEGLLNRIQEKRATYYSVEADSHEVQCIINCFCKH